MKKLSLFVVLIALSSASSAFAMKRCRIGDGRPTHEGIQACLEQGHFKGITLHQLQAFEIEFTSRMDAEIEELEASRKAYQLEADYTEAESAKPLQEKTDKLAAEVNRLELIVVRILEKADAAKKYIQSRNSGWGDEARDNMNIGPY